MAQRELNALLSRGRSIFPISQGRSIFPISQGRSIFPISQGRSIFPISHGAIDFSHIAGGDRFSPYPRADRFSPYPRADRFSPYRTDAPAERLFNAIWRMAMQYGEWQCNMANGNAIWRMAMQYGEWQCNMANGDMAGQIPNFPIAPSPMPAPSGHRLFRATAAWQAPSLSPYPSPNSLLPEPRSPQSPQQSLHLTTALAKIPQ
jgi:hypothetical protein